MSEEVIVGLDLGSTTVKVAVGQKVYSEDSNIPKLNIVGIVEIPSEGVNRGVITNIDDAVKVVSKALDKAEKLTGLPIDSLWLSINGTHITSQLSRGIVAVSKTDGEIKDEDVQRAIEAAKTVTTPPNYEILHVIPRDFSVDGQNGVKSPVGMKGMRLEVDAYIVEGMTSQINNLTKTIYLAAYDIEDILLNILAASEVALTSKQKDLGVVLVNIGSATTSLAVYEEGDLIHTAVLPIGSEHITSDIAIGLRTSIDIAEAIKIKYGIASCSNVDKKDEIDLAEFDDLEDGIVSKKYVCEIIEARVEEIFNKVDKELKKIERSGSLPAGIVVCGGGSKLTKILDIAKKSLRISASLGYANNITSVIEGVNDLSMTSAIGLVKYGEVAMENNFSKKTFNSVGNVKNKIKKLFGSFMP